MLFDSCRLGLCWRRTFTTFNNRPRPCNLQTHPPSMSTTLRTHKRIHKRWMNHHAEHSDLNARHSMFVAERAPDAKWWSWKEGNENGTGDSNSNGKDDLEELRDGKGKLAPTLLHLFKLILPLGQLSHPSNPYHQPPRHSDIPTPPPTIFLLHPSQPLSHVSRLILASLAPATPTISFRSLSRQGQAFQWSESTDVGDFVRDAARAAEFRIVMTYTKEDMKGEANKDSEKSTVVKELEKGKTGIRETELEVEVPTFADRTRYLRRKLGLIEALGGFAMLVVYWGAVARLTFWDYGWDIMEPITYLSGLTTVVLGYLWFLYQGREVSYSSVLNRSISSRRQALYQTRGFDAELWEELLAERRNLRKEIGRIAEDYDESKNKERADNSKEEKDIDETDTAPSSTEEPPSESQKTK
ncbi:hypothetical protein D9756_008164 [Leucocoprinus leucothites]|uniref:Calcium uniporter protein, mitochondrial n=1 Tax=Leucocoprinus leucothites TaxID=201217 RepID=A0A8H5FWF6_9AGAR|nr:hypothetical protein D9756_008164 [Leucoagaricus leucothites]